jgi:hypothetical protein
MPNSQYTENSHQRQDAYLLQLSSLLGRATWLRNWPVCFALAELIARVELRGDGRVLELEQGDELNLWTPIEDGNL